MIPFLLQTYPKSIVRCMIYSWMATQFTIALTSMDMWTLIGLPALRHITGTCVRLVGRTIAYKSKSQPTMAQSSTEAKFMGASDFGWLILFIWSVLWDIGDPQEAASILYEDNNACIVMAMSQKPTPRT
jgi:hypothetical protein